MAFTDPITLVDNLEVGQTFTRQSFVNGGSDWIETDATAESTRRLLFRHSNAGASVVKGGKPLRRHLVQLVHERFNSTLGKTEKATLNVTITVDPNRDVITDADLDDQIAFARSILSASNLDKILRDEA